MMKKTAIKLFRVPMSEQQEAANNQFAVVDRWLVHVTPRLLHSELVLMSYASAFGQTGEIKIWAVEDMSKIRRAHTDPNQLQLDDQPGIDKALENMGYTVINTDAVRHEAQIQLVSSQITELMLYMLNRKYAHKLFNWNEFMEASEQGWELVTYDNSVNKYVCRRAR